MSTMSPEQQLISQLESIVADKTIPLERRKAWRGVLTAARQVPSLKPATRRKTGPKSQVDPARVSALLSEGCTIRDIVDRTGWSKSAVGRVAKEMRSK